MKAGFSIVIFLFLCAFASHAEEIKVISSTTTSIVFEYTPTITDTIFHNTPFGQGLKLSVLNLYTIRQHEEGKFSLPAREVNIGVPSEFGNSISILNSEFGILDGILIPNEVSDADLKNFNGESFWSTEDFISTVTFAEYGLVRNLPSQSIKMFPVQYDPQKKQIKLFTKLVVKVNFGQSSIPHSLISDTRLTNAVLNFNVAKNWGIENTESRLYKSEGSVLANGTWYRFECPREGIYRITRNMLSQFGIDANNVDPRTIKIYNNGGYQLPENISVTRPDGLVEISITVEGESDGTFNENDQIIFYGRSNDFFEYLSASRKIIRNKNEFSKKNYYWITSGGSNGKRMEDQSSLNAAGYHNQTNTIAYKFRDDDLENIGETGRNWFGDKFTPTSVEKIYMNQLFAWVPGTEIKYSFRLVNKGRSTLPITISETDQQIYTATMSRVTGDHTIGVDHRGTANFNGQIQQERSNLKFRINSGSETDEAYLDYFEIEYTKELRAQQDSLIFYSDVYEGQIRFNLYNFSNSSITVYDISDYFSVKRIINAEISGGNFTFQAEGDRSERKKYIGVTSSAFLTPVNMTQITNSNLKGITGGAEFIIITHPVFLESANEFSNYRSNESFNRVSSIVVNVEEIYNEFSGGSLDPAAIRNFIQHAYNNWNVRPFYVLLFGDGNYDFYNVRGLNRNFIPAYEVSYSLHDIDSYPSDDFYARIEGNDLKTDVAIGRINIQNAEDAETIINKIKRYEDDPERSLWKNTITLVADDGPTSKGDDRAIHTSQSESLSINILPKYFLENKIYLAAYPTVISGSGRRKPEVNQAIINAVNQGTLMLNFIGHGDPNRWTHENVFTTDASIPQLQNEKYFFLTAATCDYGRFDQLEAQSATEILLLMEGGAIGALTAVRAVYSNLNAALNETFYKNLFSNSSNPDFCIGDAYMITKQVKTGDNDEKFHLFGDPTLKLNVPKIPVVIDSVNSQSLTSHVNINALGQVQIKGSVRDGNGNISDMDGECIVSVYDADKIIQLPEMGYQMTVQGGVIFKGRATVENGLYEIEFVVPKDISYADANGRILAYVYNDENDGLGFSRNIIVGGTNENIVNDGQGPEIEIFYDDFEFDKSYVVSQNFTLLISLKDETGLNTTGTGVGHRLEGILNDNVESPIDFSNYFVSDLNTGGKSGKVNYRFTNMESGEYSLKVKAWDVFNNMASAQSFFSVTQETGLAVQNVVNYPNPFSNNTTFTFQHNLSSSVNVEIRIYTVTGRMIRKIEEYDLFDKFVRIDWNGRDEDGNLAANGTYLYKVNVETIDGEFTKNVLGKLSIIR